MPESETVRLLQKISEDIALIKNYMKIQASEATPSILREIATTSERQQIWRLADGGKSNEDIASQVGVALRSVQYFVEEAQDAGLILMKRRGYASRVVDIVPSDWKPWKPKLAENEQQKTSQEATMKEENSSAHD